MQILVRPGWGVYVGIGWKNTSPTEALQPEWRLDIKGGLTWNEGPWEMGTPVGPGGESYDEAHNGIPNDWGINTLVEGKLMVKVGTEIKEVWRPGASAPCWKVGGALGFIQILNVEAKI